MENRWVDIRDDLPLDDTATFIGGTGEADLWLTSKHNVLICQYDGSANYVSYHPPSAIYDATRGESLPSHGDHCNLRWCGSASAEDMHDVKSIARYLALFKPSIFSDEERQTLLGDALTQMER